MVQEVLERAPRVGAPPLQFGCSSCGAVLSVPKSMAGVSGPCPLCGEWLVSPDRSTGPMTRRASAFVSRRQPLPEARWEVPPNVRPEGQINWRERRARYDRLVSWYQRSQARLCVAALFVAALTVAYLYTQGWNLPWNLPEDSVVMQFLESMARTDGGGGDLPTGPRRK